jgi:hypothetical protein
VEGAMVSTLLARALVASVAAWRVAEHPADA